MKEVHVTDDKEKSFTCSIVESPIPEPAKDQLLIKVVVSGTNPKDWKIPVFFTQLPPMNTGDDIAGYVHAVGEGVTDFKVGDRVSAFHEMMTAHGSFAEYAIAWSATTFHIPEKTSFEEAATIPLAAMTAAVGLYARLGLPEPYALVHPARELSQGGVIVYGAASAVGAFAIKLLILADIHPILAVAGRATSFVESLGIDKSKGDAIIDYRGGNDKVVEELKAAIPQGKKCLYAFDATSENGSYTNIVQVLDPEGHLTLVLPGKDYEGIPKTVHQTTTTVGSVHGKTDDLTKLGFAWFKLFGQGLKEGWFSGHPYEVIPGGLGGVETGLRNLMEGKASGVKYVYRIEETEGAEKYAKK